MRYRPPARLAHTVVQPGSGDGDEDLRVYLRHLPGGPNLGLTGVGALIWSVAAQGPSDVVEAVSDQVGEPGEDIRAEVETYLRALVMDGLLERVHHG